MTRYLKATDGEITVFRQADSGDFRSARLDAGGLGFSRAPPDLLAGLWPVVEITKAEFDVLVSLVIERQLAKGVAYSAKAPQEFWIRNIFLAEG